MTTKVAITYMLFKKRGKKFTQVVGPIFDFEIEIMKKKMGKGKINVLEESVFKNIYYQEYIDHIREHWVDKLICYIAFNKDWIGDSQLLPDRSGFISSWFILVEDRDEDGLVRGLKFCKQIGTDPFKVGRFYFEVSSIVPHVINQTPDFYPAIPRTLTGSEATTRFLAERMIEFSSGS